MARENQGLQIALIILFMLTIILGVTTYIFCSRYIEADDRAAGLESELADKTTANRTIQDESNQLKKWIGFKAEDEVEETINPQFRDDMETFAGAYDNVDQAYRPVLVHLYGLVNKKNGELTDANDALRKLQDEYAEWKRQMTEQVKTHDEARLAAEKKLADAVAMYTRNLDKIRAGKDEIEKVWNAAREKAGQDLVAVETARDNAVAEASKLETLVDQQAKELDKKRVGLPDVPDGEIRWVDQRGGMVWIDLGWGDALRRLTTFSVYPMDTTNLAKGRLKARIEVTRIRGEHRAEARIVEDAAGDPIMTGDKIYTPVWSPGEQVRFALVGLMDMDGDGKGDLQTVKQLIEMSGGKVDYWIDPEGNDEGKMTIHTRYAVVDSESLEVGEEEGKAAGVYSEVMDEVRRLAMKKITVAELLAQMGWKNRTRVVRCGREANPRDFEPKPPEGVPRSSTGPGRDPFQPRRPPAGRLSPRGGAY